MPIVVNSVDLMVDLRLQVGTTTGETLELLGYNSFNDGGGGEFYWDNNSGLTDDGGTIIYPTASGYSGNGRWLRRYSGAINVRWFGAVGDGVANDSTPFTDALAISRSIFVPPGTYLINITIQTGSTPPPFWNFEIFGESETRTFLQAASSSSPIISYGDNPDWTYCKVTALTFDGVSVNSNEGFSFVTPVGGRIEFNRCRFTQFDIGIHKPLGNIGITCNNCLFDRCNYGFKAFGHNLPVADYMHAGCNYFYDCNFKLNWKVALFVQDDNNGQGQHSLINCIFEANRGLPAVFDLYQYPGTDMKLHAPIVLINTWFESNGGSYTSGSPLALSLIATPVSYTGNNPNLTTMNFYYGAAFPLDSSKIYFSDPASRNAIQLKKEDNSGKASISIGTRDITADAALSLGDDLIFQDIKGAGSSNIRAINTANTAYTPLHFTAVYYKFWTGAVEIVSTLDANALVAKSKSGSPTTSDVPLNTYQVWEDTSGGTISLWANHGGVMKSVQLT